MNVDSRHVRRPRFVVPALGILAAGGCALALGPAASAQAPTTLKFTELNKGSTFGFVDNAPMSKGKGEPSASLGDVIVFTNPLADPRGRRIGRLYAHCTAVVAAPAANRAAFACEGLVVLSGGTLSVQAFLANANATVHGTVTGGTGSYANARGVLVSRPTKTGASDTITLLG
jgi:hypothetical protein